MTEVIVLVLGLVLESVGVETRIGLMGPIRLMGCGVFYPAVGRGLIQLLRSRFNSSTRTSTIQEALSALTSMIRGGSCAGLGGSAEWCFRLRRR